MEDAEDLKAAPAGQCRAGLSAAASGRRCQQVHPRALEASWSDRPPTPARPAGGCGRRAWRGRLHRGVLRREIDDHRARLAARLWWCATGERGSRQGAGAPRPGHPTACVIGCGFDAAETSLTSLLMETVRGWEASAHRRGRPQASRQRHRPAGPRAGRRRALDTAHAPTAARRRGWPKASGRPWKRPMTRPPAERAAPSRAAGASPPQSRATLAEADPAPAALACALAEAYGAVVALKGP